MSKNVNDRQKRPVVELEFSQTAMYALVDGKGRSSSQPADASPLESQPTVENLNSIAAESKNPLLSTGEEEIPVQSETALLTGLVIGFVVILGGYYAWTWWKTPPPLTK